MTKNEALLFFPVNEGEDIIELYDECLFEYKTYLCSNCTQTLSK